MNWEAIGAVGEILGAIAVVATLFYLASQIRQNAKSVRSQNLNTQADQLLKLSELVTQETLLEPLTRCYGQNLEHLSIRDAGAIEAYLKSALAITRNQYLHQAEGLESDWDVLKRLIPGYFSASWPKRWWSSYGRHLYEEDFARAVDEIIASSDQASSYWVGYGNETGTDDDA